MSADRVRELLESGRLHARAAASGTLGRVLAEFGLTMSDWEACRKRAIRNGHKPPTWEALLSDRPHVDDAAPEHVDDAGEFEYEEPTDPDRVPSGHFIRGISTLYDENDNVKLRWVKTQQSHEQYVAGLLEAAREEFAEWRELAPPVEAPAYADSDLLVALVLGDPHVGMYAWPDETGDDAWDLKIAEESIGAAIDHAIEVSPNAEQALLVMLGDNYHVDSTANTTTAGTRQDLDTRWTKVIGVGIRIWRRAIERMLTKYQRVRVIPQAGNHDTHSSLLLALLLAQVYENEPRVEIDTSPAAYHYHRFESVLIGVAHGHLSKSTKLPQIMACQRPQDWGATTARFWFVGHEHHSEVMEDGGVFTEKFPTLAAKDAWASAAGYCANRSMALLVFDKRDGLVNRHTIGISAVKRRLAG